MKQPDQGDGAYRHIHGAGPVDTPGQRIGPGPVLDDAAHGVGEAFLAGHHVGLARRDQPLQARQFPRHLDVAIAVQVQNINAAKRDHRPGMAAFEVLVPVDGGGKVNRAGAEKIDPARDGVIGGGKDAFCVTGAEGFEFVLIHRPQKRRERRRAQPRPQAVQALAVEQAEQALVVQPPDAGRRH